MSSNKINFLLNYFNVIEDEEVIDNIESPKIFSLVNSHILFKKSEKFLYKLNDKFLIRRTLFDYIISFDPTAKLIYSQWLLTQLSKKLKKNDPSEINQFIFEDLNGIKENLKIFDSLKKKKIFKTISQDNFALVDMKDVTDINQYRDPEILYDSIYPFLERNENGLISELKFFQRLKEADIPFEDKKFVVYTPYSLRANEILKPFNNWCTTKSGNGMVEHYTSQKNSFGVKSKLYVIINKENNHMYQIHFESNQVRNRSNKENYKDFVTNYLNKSYGLDRYLYDQIYNLLINAKTEYNSRPYLNIAIKLGYHNLIIDMYDDTINRIQLVDFDLRLTFSMKRFKHLEKLILSNCNLTEIFDEIFELKNLRILSLPNNNITRIPDEISKLKKLYTLNLNKNNISSFSDEIQKLDPSNGGSLLHLAINQNKLTDSQLDKLKKLLPNVIFN